MVFFSRLTKRIVHILKFQNIQIFFKGIFISVIIVKIIFNLRRQINYWRVVKFYHIFYTLVKISLNSK